MKYSELKNIDYLKQYKKIGIDIDETIIGESVNKEILNNFIINNYNEIEFHLITFRSDKNPPSYTFNDIEDDSELKPHMFKSLTMLPHEIYQDVNFYNLYYNGDMDWFINSYKDKVNNISIEELKERVLNNLKYYYVYKGTICHQKSIPVLIDDDYKRNIMGCQKYNIKLIITDNL